MKTKDQKAECALVVGLLPLLCFKYVSTLWPFKHMAQRLLAQHFTSLILFIVKNKKQIITFKNEKTKTTTFLLRNFPEMPFNGKQNNCSTLFLSKIMAFKSTLATKQMLWVKELCAQLYNLSS